MMWGSFGLAISMMLISVLLSFTEARGYTQKLNKATSSASVAFFFTYVSFVALNLGQQNTDNCFRCSSSEHRQTVFHGETALYTGNIYRQLTYAGYTCQKFFPCTPEQKAQPSVSLRTGFGYACDHCSCKDHPLTIIQNFVVVMITPTLINKLQWQAYLIFMCTNLAFVPLVYFWYVDP